MEKTSVGCHIDFTILLSMLKVKIENPDKKCFPLHDVRKPVFGVSNQV